MTQTVAVLGGGVAGMTAAHELAERGFSVTVYERNGIPGGKARSMPVPGTGTATQPPLPGEHGFRFFPGFYRHLPDTLARIPYPGNPHGVLDNLVTVEEAQIAHAGQREIVIALQPPDSVDDLWNMLKALDVATGLNRADVRHFFKLVLILLTTCQERVLAEYEGQAWWDFCGAADPNRTNDYRRYMAGLTRTLVAARAEEMSARTGGNTLLQLLFAHEGRFDQVLNGPTNAVWIEPWRNHLVTNLGVDYQLDTTVEALHCQGTAMTGVTVRKQGQAPQLVTADYYVAAFPVEVMEALATPTMKAAEPKLAGLHHLRRRWMNGVMFYLDVDVPLVHGHTIYIDSPWALTSISQQQFWDVDLKDFGDGQVEGILSVDVSDWEKNGVLYGRPAKECSRDEVVQEVWTQLTQHLNDDAIHELNAANVLRTFVDPDITFPNPPGVAANLEPLLVNTKGSWQHRPTAKIGITNLFLASDYVQTHTDLATMEGANEAARAAVNEILTVSGSVSTQAAIEPLHEVAAFTAFRVIDRGRLQAGLPYQFPFPFLPF